MNKVSDESYKKIEVDSVCGTFGKDEPMAEPAAPIEDPRDNIEVLLGESVSEIKRLRRVNGEMSVRLAMFDDMMLLFKASPYHGKLGYGEDFLWRIEKKLEAAKYEREKERLARFAKEREELMFEKFKKERG